MLLTLVIIHLFGLVTSNPFHKYPYVFLLDVGNEELQKTDSEQIRLSIPGGSLALRYPAIDNGDTIVHVRVSGIDFGTDLKVNIVDGGPGSKYVVVVFMGNPKVAYDAVLTIQTVNEENLGSNAQDKDSFNNIDDTKEVSEEDANNSAEESDDQQDATNFDSKAELTQASSHNYNYANNEIQVSDDYKNKAAKENTENDFENDDNEYQNSKISNQNNDVTDYDEDSDDANVESDHKENTNIQEVFDSKNAYVSNEYDNRDQTAGVVDNLYYDRLNFIRPYLYNGVGIHPDQVKYESGNNIKPDEYVEGDQGYENADVHEASKDNNNNYYDSDDSSSVES